MSIRREASSGGPDFSSQAKQYKVSRPSVLVDTFACETIRRRMFQDLLSPSNNVLKFLLYALLLSMIILFDVGCFTLLSILKSIACNHSRLYYRSFSENSRI